MIWRKPLITLIVFAALVALYGGDRLLLEKRRAAKELSERAFPLNKEDVTEATLVTPKEIITVRKEAQDHWVMTQPIQTAADKDAIEVILSNLLPALRYGEFPVDETIKLEDYGLDAATHKLKVQSKDGRELTLLVGKQAAQSGKFYAKIESENKIFSINEYIKDKLDKEPFDLRDRTVLPVAVDDVRRFALARAVKRAIEIKSPSDEGATRTTTGWQRKSENIVVAKTDDGNWQIEEPVPWQGDPVEIENLLRKLKTSKVTAFIDEPTTDGYGFDDPQIALQVEQVAGAGDEGTTATTGTQTLTLHVGDRETSPGKSYYAKRGDGSIVTIDREMFDALTEKATKLRDKKMFSLASADVASMEIETRKSKLEVKKSEQGRWVFADDAATTVDQEIVEDKIAALVNMRARDFETDEPTDLAPYKLDKPYVRLTVADKDRKKVEGINVGDLATRDNESVLFGQRRDSKSVVLLDFDDPRKFFLTKDDLMDKSLFAFAPDAVARAEVRRREAPTTFTLVREGTDWRIQTGKDEKPRRVSNFWAEDVVRGVRDLKYKELYKGNLTEKEMGLTSPTLDVVLFGKENAELARVIRGVEKGERYYTRIQPEGPVYGIEASRFGTLESSVNNLVKEQ